MERGGIKLTPAPCPSRMDNAKVRFKGEVQKRNQKPLAYPKVYKLGEFGCCVDYYFIFLFICKGLN